jgi:RNA-directed DNA polymerase
MPSGRRSLTRGSAVDQPSRRKFPVGSADLPPGDRPQADGFSFTTGKAPPRRRIAPQALVRLKGRVRELTRRTRGVALGRTIEGLRIYLTGWAGHLGFCQTPSVLRGLDRWIRRRLRAIAWLQWRNGWNRLSQLLKRGVPRRLAAQTASSAHGPWRIAASPGLNIALSNAVLAALGLPSLVATLA